MQPRLMRSRTEVILAGVCGGLGEYFAIDPVIVRLIFVLITLTTGIGVLVYPVLWMVMPKAPPRAQPWAVHPPMLDQSADEAGARVGTYVTYETRRHEQPIGSQSRPAAPPIYAEEPPPPEAYNFDPQTGQPVNRRLPADGRTIQLPFDPAPTNLAQQPGDYWAASQQPHPRRHGGKFLGYALLAIGMLVLAEVIGIDAEFVFPLLMIGAGVMLLRRR